MSRTGDVNDVRIMLFDEAVQMDVDEVLSRRGSPVPEQPRLDLFRLERLAKQGIFEEVDLADAQIVRRTPVAIHLVEHFGRERTVGLRRFGFGLPFAAIAVDRATSKINLERFSESDLSSLAAISSW